MKPLNISPEANSLILRGSISARKNHAMIDPSIPGSNGYGPNYSTLQALQPHAQKQLIRKVLELPRYIRYLADPIKAAEGLISIMETHVKSVTGLKNTITLETDGTNVGYSPGMIRVVTKSTREESQITQELVDIKGKPFQTTFSEWIEMALMSPELQRPGIIAMNPDVPDDYTMGFYAMTEAFIEPDDAGRCVQCWVVVNMFPKTSGTNEGKYDNSAGAELVQLSIDFEGFAINNLGTALLGQAILDSLSAKSIGLNALPSLPQSNFLTKYPATAGVSPDVAAIVSTGYAANVIQTALDANAALKI